ncbi:metal ABC transporter substrate-binding protein [Leptolyngbya sp. FACHB-36]|nr:metal ABC transporter substrate-binding protein [Leptolyngbya sp. FACHB-36]
MRLTAHGTTQLSGNHRRRSFLRFTAVLAILPSALCLMLSGCGTPNSTSSGTPDARPKVVSTSTILTDLAAEVGQDQIQLVGILKPGADPHIYEPVPGDIKQLEQADVIVYNGYNLEPGLIRLMESAGAKAEKLAAGEVVTPLQLAKEGRPVPDPHVWGDVKNVIQMVAAIRDALSKANPQARDRFAQNAAQLTKELEQLDTWIRQQIQTIPPEKRRLVTTHDAFQYYGRAYSMAIVGTLIGISTEEQPSAQTVQTLVQAIKTAGVPAIFAETTINPALIQTVASEANVQLAPKQLYSDSIGAPGSDGDTYIKMMVANTTAIVGALGGTVTPFKSSS